MEDPLKSQRLPNIPGDEIVLNDGQVMRVIARHHASPIERWQMWKMLSKIGRDADMNFHKRLKFHWITLSNLLAPNCVACTYEVVNTRE